MEDIQSWWEVPSIAYFCSLFRTAFNLLDFDIEELEEALLTDGTEESASSLLTELIVRLLNGCLGNNGISAFNYQMYLRRLFRRKCQETGRYNPFNTDIDFQFLPLRTKVEILYALCDFRLDTDDVFDLFKNLEAESLRVEPLGWDDNDSAYWYFYGTRLYREDIIKKPKGKNKKKKGKESKKRGWFYGDDWLDDEETERVWQVVCFTEEDWTHLTEKFSKATSKVEKELYRSLSQNFLPEIPRLFQEKERLQRKRLLELAPRRTSSRVLQKIKQKEEDTKQSTHEVKEEEERKETPDLARENRAKRRNLLRSKSVSSDTSEESVSAKEEMPQKISKQTKGQEKRSKNSSATQKGEPPPEPLIKTGRKTNNSLASATGQIVIPDNDEPVSSTRKKLKTSQIFSQTDEDIQTDMYKVLKQLTAHDDAWPFMDPVEEEYAPNYYAVIRRPMDLRKMEERLDSGYYTDFSIFKADFKLIVNNCRLYNGQDNEYTMMVDNLQTAFDRLTERYIHRLSSSDEEIAVEYQIPTPSRKHKLKSSESPSHHKRKKRKSHSDTGEPKSSSSDIIKEEKQDINLSDTEEKKNKESHTSKQGKIKKKRKSHHRHGKHSKNHKKDSHRSEHADSTKSKHGKKQKHGKNKDGKKSKQKKKKNKRHESESADAIKRSASQESLESSNRSRSASPLPSIHTPTPSPTELDQSEPQENLGDADFFKDKYDKIKERKRNATKDAWESLFDYKQKTVDKQKQNLHIPEKDKNQKLRETIEKLKAKNEKYKDTTLYTNLFTPNHSSTDTMVHSNNIKDPKTKDDDSDDEEDSLKRKTGVKKGSKKNSAKNESASEALEQAVKDISKWLDDAPKGSTTSSPCDSPAQTISTEEHDNSRLDDEFSQGEKPVPTRKEISRKRPSSREPKLVKRREIQRTIDRLQPGKSKGNLLTNMSNKNLEKTEEVTPLGPQNKVRDSLKSEEPSPKLSLGSVLPTVEFTLGNDHNFGNTDDTKTEDSKDVGKATEIEKDETLEEKPSEQKTEEFSVQITKKDAEVETEPQITTKPNQEKATPNLSAWFKAFGAPKNTSAVVPKKKLDEGEPEEKVPENSNNNIKPSSPKNAIKYDSPTNPETPIPDGGDSPLPSIVTTPRQRRTSTGSSVSERSSFSQDLDSPRHQMSHTSPLIQSPASPRTEDFQKITYPIINGTVRAGFYQDTTSVKSSPDKSCSPREAPQSPYSPYSQHVYASNSITGSSTPNYFVDHNKSPLPTFNQNPQPYFDSKTSTLNKPPSVHDDYTGLGPTAIVNKPACVQDDYTSLGQTVMVNKPAHVQDDYTGLGQTAMVNKPAHVQDDYIGLGPTAMVNKPSLVQNDYTGLSQTAMVNKPARAQDDYTGLGPTATVNKPAHVPDDYTGLGPTATVNKPARVQDVYTVLSPTSTINKPPRVQDDYTVLGQDPYQQAQYTGPFSSAYTPYPQTQATNFSQIQQNSPQTLTSNTLTSSSSSTQVITDSKTTLFPVKKRTYNEPDQSSIASLKLTETKDVTGTPTKNDYQKITPLHSISSSMSATSVDDIALALSEKSELAKIKGLRDKSAVELSAENRESIKFDANDSVHANKKDGDSLETNEPIGMIKKDNVDMVNMGYMNPEIDRRNSGETHELEYARDVSKHTLNLQQKGYEVDAIAMNLGVNNQTLQKNLPKSNITASNIPPAHSQERSHNEINMNQNLVHAHHNQCESVPGCQNISNFSMSDIDLANKKLFGNWKMANQMRKQDLLPSDYSTNYSVNNSEKMKNEANVSSNKINYNKNLQHQYSSYNAAIPSAHRAQEFQQNHPGELRIPNPRGILKGDHNMSVPSSINDNDVIAKNIDTIAKSQKTDKIVQNHPLVNSNSYKTPYNNPTSLPLDSLRNIPNIPQMLERYNDERYLSTFATNTSSIYHEKQFQMAQMFNKSMSSDVHPVSTSVSIYTQPSVSMSKDNSIYKTSNATTTHTDTKPKKRKRTSDSKQTGQIVGSQTYHQTPCNSDVLTSVKASMMPGSAFNFGTSTNMALSSGLYGDNGSFSIEDFRNSTANQLMAANYMVAAVAHQQRNSVESNADKLVKPAHQNSSHSAGSFPFIGHSQVRAGYPFVGGDPTSPLYQQYLQRHQEELIRQTGAQIMSLYPPGYPASLGVRQPYDSINRHSWL